MKFTPLLLQGVVLVEPMVHEDARGSFWESYRNDLFGKHGIKEEFVQDNQSFSFKGVLRGLHWQVEPAAQAKLVRVARGEIFDVVVDVRPDSPTFGKWLGEWLSSKNKKMFYIPPGFAHGFLTLSDEAEVLYKVSAFYSPEHERSLIWNDPTVGIAWPAVGRELIISDRDRKNPLLKEVGVK